MSRPDADATLCREVAELLRQAAALRAQAVELASPLAEGEVPDEVRQMKRPPTVEEERRELAQAFVGPRDSHTSRLIWQLRFAAGLEQQVASWERMAALQQEELDASWHRVAGEGREVQA